jgi:uncharacterized protein YndB with AHSA1/START domain
MAETTKSQVIERTLNAPVEKVWDAWTKPEMVKQWWGPEGFTSPKTEIDLTVGGKYLFGMHGPKGSEWDKDMFGGGEYREIVPQQKLVMTDYFSDEQGNKLSPTEFGQSKDFPEESVYTVLFESLNNNTTKLSLLFSLPTSESQQAAIDQSQAMAGWKSSLNKLQALVEK